MHDQAKTTREIWARHMSHEGISTEEQEKLCEVMSSDAAIRQQLLTDDVMHRMLRSLAVPVDDGDEFVNGVLSRCVEASQDSSPAATPEPPPIVNVIADVKAAEVPSLSVVEPQKRRPPRRKVLLSSRVLRPLVAVAALGLFFFLGVMAGSNRSEPSQVADGDVGFKSGEQSIREDSIQKPTKQAPSIREPSIPIPPQRSDRSAPESGIATLVSADFGAWERPRMEGSRLQPGELKLERGEAEIAFDDGTHMQLAGPTELSIVSPQRVDLHRGKVSLIASDGGNGMLIQTPTSHLIDQGAQFDLVVNDRGASDVLVHDGSVTLQPWVGQQTASPMVLTSTDVNRATIWEPAGPDPRSPLSMFSRGDRGNFHGQISVNGRSIDFESPEAFETVRQRVEKQFRESAETLENNWMAAVQRFGGGAGGGELSFNGVKVNFDNLDQAMELQRKLMEATVQQGAIGDGARAEAFQGQINVNGEVRTFSSADEFREAQREMFGPLQAFGFEDMNEGKLPDVFKAAPDANPFLPKK